MGQEEIRRRRRGGRKKSFWVCVHGHGICFIRRDVGIGIDCGHWNGWSEGGCAVCCSRFDVSSVLQLHC